MDYIRLYTTLHDDPGMKRLSDKAFRYYMNALSWCGLHETRGVFEVFGKIPKQVTELVAQGKFEPTDDPARFVIHGYEVRQSWEKGVQARREKARQAADARWHPDRNASSDGSGMPHADAEPGASGNAPSNAQERRGEERRGEETQTLALSPPAPSEKSQVKAAFERFYAAYPRKKSPGDAERAYAKAFKIASPETILAGLERIKPEWAKRDLDKVPYPATWLNARGWEDVPDPDDDRSPEARKALALMEGDRR